MSPRFRWIAGGALIALMTFVAYAPAMRAGFIWDDDAHVQKNLPVQAWDGLAKIWLQIGATQQYYPMTFTSFWIEQKIWGHESATGYHIVNIALHALNAVLVWVVLKYLRVPGAWLAAAIFALHPVCVESVAWVSERKNVLSGAFYLSSMLCYLRWIGIGDDLGARSSGRRDPPAWLYWLAMALFVGAVASKTVAASLPAAILLILWWKRGRVTLDDMRDAAPMLLLGIAAGLLTASLERQQIGARGPEWDLSAVERVLIAGRVVWFYAAKLVWPANLAFIYERWSIDVSAWWQWLFPAGAAAVLLVLWLARRKIGRGPLTAALFFGGTLVPAMGFINVFPMQFSFVADHFQYLASLGLIALAAAGAALLMRRLAPRAVALHATGAAVILAALGSLTWRQAHIYKDAKTVWHDTLAKNPDSWMPHLNLGIVLLHEKNTDDAIHHFEQTVRLKPVSTTGGNNWGLISAHNNWAAALVTEDRYRDAAAHFLAALRLQERQRPDDPMTLENARNIRRNLDLALQLAGISQAELERSLATSPQQSRP